MSAAGESDPSDSVECEWRSITDPTLPEPGHEPLVAGGGPLGAECPALAERSLKPPAGRTYVLWGGYEEDPEGGRACQRKLLWARPKPRLAPNTRSGT